jgi:DNA-binding PadR family transcriptional regulator
MGRKKKIIEKEERKYYDLTEDGIHHLNDDIKTNLKKQLEAVKEEIFFLKKELEECFLQNRKKSSHF